MRAILTFSLLAMSTFLIAQKPVVRWANTFFNPDNKELTRAEFYEIQTNAKGQTAVLGAYTGALEIGLSAPLEAENNREAQFLAFFDSDGALFWAKNLLLSGGEDAPVDGQGGGVEIDSAGNVYVISKLYTQTIKFDTAHSLSRRCLFDLCQDAYIAKFGPDGAYQWSRSLSGSLQSFNDTISADGIKIAPDGEIVFTGNYSGESFSFEDSTFTDLQRNGFFVGKIRPDGTLNWVKFSKQKGEVAAQVMCPAPNGDIWVGGVYSNGPIDFGNNVVLTNFVNPDVLELFVARFDRNGTAQEAINFNSTSFVLVEPYLNDMRVGRDNTLYLVFDYQQFLRNGNTTIRQTSNLAAQILGYKDATLSSLVVLPYSSFSLPMYSMALGPNDRFYTGGFFEKTLSVPGSGQISAAGAQDLLLLIGSTQIAPLKAYGYGGDGFEGVYFETTGRMIQADAKSCIYLAGQYEETMKIGPFFEEGKGLFLCKIDAMLSTEKPESPAQPLVVQPNPNDGVFRLILPVEESGFGLLQIIDIQGKTLVSMPTFSNAVDVKVALPQGVYALLYTGENVVANGRLSIR